MNSIILQTVARVALYVLLILAAFLLFAGHNAPGGGFIAGLLAAAAFILQMLAFDLEYVAKLFPVNPLGVVATGLILAAGVGFVPMLLGYPFLTSAFTTITVPIIGRGELTSVFFFDLGVFFVVVGAMMTVIKEMASDNSYHSRVDEMREVVKEDSELWKR